MAMPLWDPVYVPAVTIVRDARKIAQNRICT